MESLKVNTKTDGYDPATFDKKLKKEDVIKLWDKLGQEFDAKTKSRKQDQDFEDLLDFYAETYGEDQLEKTVKLGKDRELTLKMKGYQIHTDEDVPSVLEKKNGVVLTEAWYKNGVPSRSIGPAMICYNDSGKKLDEYYIVNGKIQKSISYYSDGFYKVAIFGNDGKTILESYDKDNQLHSEVGPARKILTKYGSVESVEFFKHGKLHNTLEPAKQTKDGKEFFIEGVQYTAEEFKEYNLTGKLKSTTNEKKTPTTMKDKLGKAGTRIATRKLVKGLQNLLADQMTSNIKNAKTRSAAKEGILSFLESEAGKGALGILLGSLLPYAKSLPMISKYGDKLDAVAEEFQVEGLAVVGEFAVDQLADLVGPATSLIQAYLESVSTEETETTKVRVDATVTDAVKHEEHEEEAHSHKEKLSRNKK